MIAPLRARHRSIFVLLAILLPLLVIIALSVRSPEPPPNELPAEMAIEVPNR